jgi:hypothetical protein
MFAFPGDAGTRPLIPPLQTKVTILIVELHQEQILIIDEGRVQYYKDINEIRERIKDKEINPQSVVIEYISENDIPLMFWGSPLLTRLHGVTVDIMAAWEDNIGESDGTRGTIAMATTMSMALLQHTGKPVPYSF